MLKILARLQEGECVATHFSRLASAAFLELMRAPIPVTQPLPAVEALYEELMEVLAYPLTDPYWQQYAHQIGFKPMTMSSKEERGLIIVLVNTAAQSLARQIRRQPAPDPDVSAKADRARILAWLQGFGQFGFGMF